MKKITACAVLFTTFLGVSILPNISRAETSFSFTKNLKSGMTNNDVKELQKYLNNNGFPLAINGVGSKGKETAFFGPLTKIALIKFQEKNRLEILDPQGLKHGTGILQSFTRALINKITAGITNTVMITGNSTSSIPILIGDFSDPESTSSIVTSSTTTYTFSIIRRGHGKTNVSAPPAPTEETKTSNTITLTANSLNQFSIDLGTSWQDSEMFTGLTPSTEYFFVARVKETANTNASPASASTSITTSPEMIASFTANPTSGDAPLTVNFTNNTSGYTADNPITWLWEFGNGATSDATNPSYEYASLGSFVARLTTTNLDGSSTVTQNIQVGPLDDASFYYPSATLCLSGSPQTPNITGYPGGTFSSTPSGLTLNPTTGTIILSISLSNIYMINYTTNGASPNTASIFMTLLNASSSASFSYSASTFTQNGFNPSPIFVPGASAGIFTAPAGIVFAHVNTGEINLASSTPDTYIVTNTILASGACSESIATTTVTITL